MRSQAMIRKDLEHAISDGDTVKVQKLATELASAPLLERAQQVADLRRILAEMDAARPELQQTVSALRMKAIQAQENVRAAEKAANLAARAAGEAQNRFSQHNGRRRELQNELDALLSASAYDAQVMGAPIVRDLTRRVAA